MSAASAAVIGPFPRAELKTVGLVSTAHGFSHFYMLALPPLFPVLNAELGLSYSALGLLLAVYAIATGCLQIPMGLLVDRVGGRAVLILGLGLNAFAILLVGLVPVYWAMLGCMVIAGAGNAVFHPADYAILAARVAKARVGRAFSMHLFAGHVGWMLAPPAVLALTALGGWRLALMSVGLAGMGYAGLLAVKRDNLSDAQARLTARAASAQARADGRKTGLALLLTPLIAALFLFYMVISMATHGIQSFSVVAFVDLHGITLPAASAALTTYFVAAALGTLTGGWLADRVIRHHLATGIAFAVSAGFVAVLGMPGLPVPGIYLFMFLAGFTIAVVAPLRDVMVRNATPPGSIGTAFGIVTTGFSLGLAISPLLMGWLADSGRPAFIFWATALITLLGIVSVVAVRKVSPAPPSVAVAAARS